MSTPNKARKWPLRLGAGAALAALAGCAVVVVDVDVYKGPLADNERVQIEQMASMAVAAKPLLIRLRDELAKSGALRSSAYDRDGFDCDLAFIAKGKVLTEEAQFVNATLYLYENISTVDERCGKKAKLRNLDQLLYEETATNLKTFAFYLKIAQGFGDGHYDWVALSNKFCTVNAAPKGCEEHLISVVRGLLGFGSAPREIIGSTEPARVVGSFAEKTVPSVSRKNLPAPPLAASPILPVFPQQSDSQPSGSREIFPAPRLATIPTLSVPPWVASGFFETSGCG